MGIIYDTLIKMNEDPVDQPPAVVGSTDATTSDATPAKREYKNGTIGKGSPPDQIKGLQKQLGIPESGTWDPATDKAVRDKQKEIGATPDGKWGPDSRAKFAAKNPPMPPKKPEELAGMTDKGAANQNQTTPTAPAGPAPDGAVIKSADIPWAEKFPFYQGADMVKKNGKWTTQATPQWNGMGATANQPDWIATLEKIYATKNPSGAGSQAAAPATQGPNGEPLVNYRTQRGENQVGYWQSTSGKGTKNWVQVPGGKVQESITGYSQDPVLARIVELSRR
jgi:hypothetical protein